MSDHAFVTESRRKVVNGNTDEYADSTVRVYRSETKKQARMALDELVQIAGSDHIDTTDVFEVEQVVALISEIFTPSADESITPFDQFDGDAREHVREHPYRVPLESQLRFALNGHRDALYGPPNIQED